MPHRDSSAICGKIDAALDYISGQDESELRPWLIWQLDEIMAGPRHIDPEDCTSSELMSLLAVLAPAFSRKLSGTTAPARPAKLLTLILGDAAVTDGATGS
jgi:hypothetical protein